MKINMEFNVPEDDEMLKNCMKAQNYLYALQEINEMLRKIEKYETVPVMIEHKEFNDEIYLEASTLREWFFDLLSEHEISL